MIKDKSRWIAYNNWGPKGPYLILIIDCDWWEENLEKINEWFDLNCPICKPEPSDTIISFQTQGQYTLWRLSWSP